MILLKDIDILIIIGSQLDIIGCSKEPKKLILESENLIMLFVRLRLAGLWMSVKMGINNIKDI